MDPRKLPKIYSEVRNRIADKEYLRQLIHEGTLEAAIQISSLSLIQLLVENVEIEPDIRYLNFRIQSIVDCKILKLLLRIPGLLYTLNERNEDSYFIVINNTESKILRRVTNIFVKANFDFTFNDSLLKALTDNEDLVHRIEKSNVLIPLEKFIDWFPRTSYDAQHPLFTRIIRTPEMGSLFEIAVNNKMLDLATECYMNGPSEDILHMTPKILSHLLDIDDDYIIEDKYEHLIDIDIFLQLVKRGDLESVKKFYRKFDLNHPLHADQVIENAIASENEELFFFLLDVGLHLKQVIYSDEYEKRIHTLTLVADCDSERILMECINQNFNLSYTDDNQTLIQQVLLLSKFDFARLIMKRVYNLHSVRNGINVINIAVSTCTDNELDIIQYLVSKNIELELGPVKQRPLLMALYRNQIGIAECLVSHLDIKNYADHFHEYSKFFIKHGYDREYLGFILSSMEDLQLLYYEVHPERINDFDKNGKHILFYPISMKVFYFLIYNGVDIYQPGLLEYYLNNMVTTEKIFVLLELGLRVDNIPPVFQQAIDLDIIKAPFNELRIFKPLFARRLMLASIPNWQDLPVELRKLILEQL